MAWYRIGDKPLPQPMMTYFTDAYMRHQASISLTEPRKPRTTLVGPMVHSAGRDHEAQSLALFVCVCVWVFCFADLAPSEGRSCARSGADPGTQTIDEGKQVASDCAMKTVDQSGWQRFPDSGPRTCFREMPEWRFRKTVGPLFTKLRTSVRVLHHGSSDFQSHKIQVLRFPYYIKLRSTSAAMHVAFKSNPVIISLNIAHWRLNEILL